MSFLKTAEACLERGFHNKTLNAFIITKDHGIIRVAASAADERVNTDSQLSPIDGQLIAIKDNISTSDLPTTCASSALAGFCSPYEAAVVKKLVGAGAIIIGKTNLDEFGMGSHSVNSAYGPVSQGKNDAVSAGGSSGGSAVAVATEQCWTSIGTDTGGSVRLPAAYNGVVGFKPSYGMISRFGVVPYANSLDTVGIVGRQVDHIKEVFKILRGFDAKDPTTLTDKMRLKLVTAAEQRTRGSAFRIGVPLEYNTKELQPIVRLIWKQAISRLSKDGHEMVPVSLPATRLALPAYYVLAPAEASSNLAKYDGVKYGHPASDKKREDSVLFATTRGQNLGDEVRRRILLGSFSLSASAVDNYFLQAQRIRRVIQQDFDAVFSSKNHLYEHSKEPEDGVDFLLCPTAPSLPPKLKDLAQRTSLDSYLDDILTVPASLAGLPAISIPTNTAHIDKPGSVGLQLIGQFGDDDLILNAAELLGSSLWERL